MLKVETLDFQVKGDERGSLVALESNRNIPFSIARAYYIFGTQPGVRRGLHAHHTLEQIMVCLAGSCKVLLEDKDSKVTVDIKADAKGLRIRPMIWHEMFEFSPDCVLLVLADQPYDEKDYIRSYDEFKLRKRYP